MQSTSPSKRGKPKPSPVASALQRMQAAAEERYGPIPYIRIARELGAAKSAVSGWFAGTQQPRDKYLLALAHLYAFGDERLEAAYRADLLAAAGRTSIAVAAPNLQLGTLPTPGDR